MLAGIRAEDGPGAAVAVVASVFPHFLIVAEAAVLLWGSFLASSPTLPIGSEHYFPVKFLSA